MPKIEPALRPAWFGTAVVAVVAVVALFVQPLVVPALVVAVVVCAVTATSTGRNLQALRRQAQIQEHESLHDPVTELPNRTLFHQHAARLIGGAGRRGTLAAVMLLDLDRFKEVNDTLGHHQGDLLLHEVAGRLRRSLRPDDVVARLGGDEFAVIAGDLQSLEDAVLLADRIRESVCASVELCGVALEIETSIGIAVAPDHASDSEQLLRFADIAMYQAKRQHTGVEFYTADADESSRERLRLLADLRSAINDGQLVLHYQPKAEASTGRVTGVEALVRWQHPERGLLFPDEFIPLAENTGLMRPLTSHVLELALSQCRAWRDAGHEEMTVAVNVSTRNLLDGALPGEVAERLITHGLPPSALEIEITETTLMVDPLRAKTVLAELSRMGVGLAIDDFGTGYTSLSWLGELPITTLKIDKSFVMRMDTRAEDEAIVRSSVQLGGNLGLKVIAEGVENQAVWSGLTELGCDCIQGYYLSRPQPVADLDLWLAQRSAALRS